MASKGDHQHLLNVGREGFAALDEFFGPRRVPPPPFQGLQGRQRQLPATHVQNGHVSPPKEGVLNCLEAAEIYGGALFVDYRKRKPAPIRKVYH